MLDILIAAAIGAGAIHGFATGAIKQVASLLGIFVSFVVAFNLMHAIGEATYRYVGASEEVAPLVGFVIVFAIVQIGIIVAARLTEKAIGAMKLGGVNRLLGTGVGAAKAALALSVAFVVLGSVGFPTEESRSTSRLYPAVASFLPTVWSVFSDRTGITSLSDVFQWPASTEGRDRQP